MSKTEGTRTSATTSWILGAARAARSRAAARAPDPAPGSRSRSEAIASRCGVPHSTSATTAASSVASGPVVPREISPRTVAGLRPAAEPTASRSSASGRAAPIRALRRRAVRSRSASGATKPAAGSPRATATASRPPTAGDAAAAHTAPISAPTSLPAMTAETGTLSASPARWRRWGIRNHNAAPATVRSRPPLSAPASRRTERPTSSPPLPASSQRPAAASSTARATIAWALIARALGGRRNGSRILDPSQTADRRESRCLENGREREQRRRDPVGQQACDEPRLDQLGEQRRTGGHRDHQEPREARLRRCRASIRRDPVALRGGCGEAAQEPGEVAAAELLREQSRRERVHPRRAKPGLERAQRLGRRAAELEVGAQPRELRGRRSVNRARRGGERRAGRTSTRERVRDRGGDLRQAALHGKPITGTTMGHRPRGGPWPGQGQEGRRAGTDEERSAEEESAGPERGEPAALRIRGGVALAARAPKRLHGLRHPATYGRRSEDRLPNRNGGHPAARGGKQGGEERARGHRTRGRLKAAATAP